MTAEEGEGYDGRGRLHEAGGGYYTPRALEPSLQLIRPWPVSKSQLLQDAIDSFVNVGPASTPTHQDFGPHPVLTDAIGLVRNPKSPSSKLNPPVL